MWGAREADGDVLKKGENVTSKFSEIRLHPMDTSFPERRKLELVNAYFERH